MTTVTRTKSCNDVKERYDYACVHHRDVAALALPYAPLVRRRDYDYYSFSSSCIDVWG